jgi:hypothetical protein
MGVSVGCTGGKETAVVVGVGKAQEDNSRKRGRHNNINRMRRL